MCQPLLIVGASVRAAAFSARRAGFAPFAVDMFGDADLRDCCPTIRVEDYPNDLVRVAAELPACPWLYTGALENRPDLVDQISLSRPLYGNSGRVLRAVRNPRRLSAALRSAGLKFPDLRRDRDAVRVGRWLRKPFRSCGGRRIVEVAQDDLLTAVCQNGPIPDTECDDPSTCYLERFIEGPSCSAVFVAAGGRAVLAGVTEQLVGCPWAGAGRFQYAGSVGPIRLTAEHRRQFERIGDCIAQCFHLSGLFGVDAVLGRDGVWVVEVNPRYTASVEVLERGTTLNLVALHVTACRSGCLPEKLPPWRGRCFGKAVIYARRAVTVPETFRRFVAQVSAGATWPAMADVPSPGTVLRAGQPVTTVFACGKSPAAVKRQLRQRADEVQRVLAC